MKDGFISVAVATPEVEVANCVKNAAATVQLVEEAAARGVKLLVLPELDSPPTPAATSFCSPRCFAAPKLPLQLCWTPPGARSCWWL